ncbi:hypothetical protein F0562_019259 [Nyssa sinensis]|uniref:UDP-rhamnose:rhamnosyltransferase 1 n=1 Tax=Nyssa sinensis TaxID=561372 RepID=A0A5J4ZCC9_9ASTE|nr:hypothetical protein F0562_019259 [Nyssa sinensis]
MVKDIHVVMLPWSAFGHLIPFLQLSIALAKAGVHVSFVSTPKNIQRLPKVPPDVSALINLVALPLPAVDRNLLPEDAEATVDIPFEKIQYLKLAYDLLQQPFKQFIADQSPDWIVVDFSPHWAVEIAQQYGISLINFSVFSAAATAFLGPPEYLTGDNQKRIRSSPKRITDAQRLAKLLHASQAVAVRSCKEFEEEYLNLVPKIMRKPVIPVGLLPPEKPEEREFTDGHGLRSLNGLMNKSRSQLCLCIGSDKFSGASLPAVDRNLLPEDAEATVDIPFEKIQYLKLAYDLLQQPFKQFIADQSPDWIVVDFSPHWAVEIAQQYSISLINFYVTSAATTVFFGPPEYLTGDNQKRIRSSPERITDAQRLAKLLHASQAVAVRSCKELEEEYLNLVPKIMGKPVIPVGLLPPEKPEEREFTDGSWIKIFKWLDEQKPKSVVFVGFGSECKLNKDQIYEIAYGLELSELPFLWALRKPSWAIDDLDALPLGFSHRTSGKGVVHIGWAPQVEILGHPSVGGSLFHSGWGSVIETLQYGHRVLFCCHSLLTKA